MAICHLRTRVGSAARGQSAAAKSDYVTREGKYGRDAGEVEHVEHGHMPEWAADDHRRYWQAADAGERANGRLFVEVQVALPVELDREQRRELAKTFARRLTDGEQLPYTVAIHRGLSRKPDTPDNPHVHIVLSERSNDGQARSAETWFRRANRKNPERGGARKVSHLQAREWPESIRQGWAAECNRALQRAGRPERIDPRTLAEQSREALKRGDLEQAEALNRAPEPKRGAGDAIQRRYERGEAPEPSRAVAAWERTRAANARWRQECQQRSQKVGRVRAALDVAERMIPASQEERAIGRAVGEAIGRRMAQAGRSDVERPGPSSSSPQQEPTLWERYQQRWPNDHEGGDRERVQTISGQSEAEKDELRERFMREVTKQQWDGSSVMTHTDPQPLPRSLAPKDKAAPDAAQSEWVYAQALPERYRQQWEQAGISQQADEVEAQTRNSLRARLSRNPDKHVEDAVRRECGPQAQRLDKAMREDMEKHRPQWNVQARRGDMLREEHRADLERSLQEMKSRRREPERSQDRDTVEVLLREHQRVSNLWDAASKGGDRQIALEGEAQRAENALYERSCKLPSDERHEYEKLAEERSGPQLSR